MHKRHRNPDARHSSIRGRSPQAQGGECRSAGNTRAVERTILTDNHAPAAPLRLSVDGGTGWTSRTRFGLRWAFPQQTAAPIARSLIQLCPARSRDESTCTAPQWLGPATSAGVTVPRADQWRARIWLQDAAGNQGPAAETVLRVDDKPPVLSLQRPSPDHPALIRVAARDDASGLGTREISCGVVVHGRGSVSPCPCRRADSRQSSMTRPAWRDVRATCTCRRCGWQ